MFLKGQENHSKKLWNFQQFPAEKSHFSKFFDFYYISSTFWFLIQFFWYFGVSQGCQWQKKWQIIFDDLLTFKPRFEVNFGQKWYNVTKFDMSALSTLQ